MEISLLTPYWKNSYGGGVKIYSIHLVNNLQKYYNINVNVLFREGVDENQHYMGYNKIIFIINSILFLLKKRNNRIISLGTWYCILPALILKLISHNKVVFIPLSEIEKISTLQRIFFKFLLTKVDYIVINTSLSKYHYETKIKMDLSNSIIVPIAAYIEPVNYDEVMQFKQKYGIQSENKIILIQGFLSNKIKAEGILLSLKIIEKMHIKYKIKLVLTGYGPYVEYVSPYIKEHNLNEVVVMTGLLSKPSVPLKASDIFLFPWLGEDEGGLALIEAMLMGKPIVYARNSNSEIIQNKITGLLTDTSENGIMNAIKILLTDKQLSKELGKNAQKYSQKHYTWEIYTKKLLKLIK
jgi:glycosyltransferase involved in cell wall biosynthesis